MAPKRPATADQTEAPQLNNKFIKPEDHQQPLPSPPHDFSNSVKKKLSSSSRTGQACDRCKVRKIRCDARAGGCSPCAQNNTPCKTTDRITGRATTRGHTETLEVENDHLRRTIGELQAQIRDLGAEVKPTQQFSPYGPPATHGSNSRWHSGEGPSPGNQSAGYAGHQNAPPYSDQSIEGSLSPQLESLRLGALPTFKAGCVGDNYLGISSADDILSPIKGTSLTFFGTEIDLTEFAPVDADDMNAPTSYHTFLRVAIGKQSVDRIPLPPEAEVRQYVTWYFRSLHPYAPIFHRPTFMHMLDRMYHDHSFTPSAAQTVQVHMLLASLKFQISTRNANHQLLGEAHEHYLHSISLFSDLLLHHALEDMQALTLIAMHLRNFPKPGAAWFASQITLSVAIELGLHRSSKAWANATPTIEPHEIELRKRIFWTLFALLVGLSGRLGRPTPIRLDDLDVELPEPENDTEEGAGQPVVNFRDCSFQIGICAPGIAIILNKIYSTIYAVRQSPQTYERIVRQLDEEILAWRNSLPSEFSLDSRADQENYIFVRYLHAWQQEARLVLHHPALCRSTSLDYIRQNNEICLDASKQLLRVVSQLREYKSLDIPWVNVTLYLAAIFTTLFIYTQHKDDMTATDLDDLRSDMSDWRIILKDIGSYYGTGDKLANAVSNIVENGLNNINAKLMQRTASAAVARTAAINHPQLAVEKGAQSGFIETYGSVNTSQHHASPVDAKPYLSPVDPHGGQDAFPNATFANRDTHGGYRAPTAAHSSSYTASIPERPLMVDEDRGLQATLHRSPTHAHPHHGHEAAYGLVSTGLHQPTLSTRTAYPGNWQEWTRQNVVANLSGAHAPPYSPVADSGAQQHPHMSSANALMALGGSNPRANAMISSGSSGHASHTTTANTTTTSSHHMVSQGPVVSHHAGMSEGPAQWPTMLFNLQYPQS